MSTLLVDVETCKMKGRHWASRGCDRGCVCVCGVGGGGANACMVGTVGSVKMRPLDVDNCKKQHGMLGRCVGGARLGIRL